MFRLMRTLNIWVFSENLGYFLNLLFRQRGISAYGIGGGRRDPEALGSVTAERGLGSIQEQLSFWMCLWDKEKSAEVLSSGLQGVLGNSSPTVLWRYLGSFWFHVSQEREGTTVGQHWAHSMSMVPCSFLLQWLLVSFRPYSLPSHWGSTKNTFRKTC